MQCLEVSSAVRPIYGSLGVKRLTEESAVWRVFLPEATVYLSCSRILYHLWSRNFHVLCPKLYPEPSESISKTSQNFCPINFIKLYVRQIEFQFVSSLDLFRNNSCCLILDFRRYVKEDQRSSEALPRLY